MIRPSPNLSLFILELTPVIRPLARQRATIDDYPDDHVARRPDATPLGDPAAAQPIF